MLLNLHSYYSLRYGTFSLRQLIEGMVANGYDTAVLTDINNSTASLDFIRESRAAGLNGFAGIEFRNGDRILYIGIAKSERGFKELNDFMTESNRRGRPLPSYAPEFKKVFVVYPYMKFDGEIRENEYIGIRPSDVNRFRMDKTVPIERCLILHTVTFDPEDFKLHTQLRAIDNNILISQLDPGQVAQRDEVFIPRDKLLAYYRDCPQLIANTEKLLEECRFDFVFKESKNKKTFTGNRYDDKQLLQKYAMDG